MDISKLKKVAELWVALGGNTLDVTLQWISLRELVEKLRKSKDRTKTKAQDFQENL